MKDILEKILTDASVRAEHKLKNLAFELKGMEPWIS